MAYGDITMIFFEFSNDAKFLFHFAGRGLVKNQTHLRRVLDTCEFFYVNEGDLYIDQRGVRYHLTKGDYFISEKGVSYGGYRKSTADFHWVHFDYPDGDAFFSQSRSDKNCIPQSGHLDNADSLVIILLLIEQYGLDLEKKRVNDLLVHVLIRDLCSIMNRGYGQEKENNNIRFQQIIEYFHENPYLNEVHDLKSMAEFFGLSEKYLIRLFKKNVGISPCQYLISKKIQKAEEMLCNTDLPIKTIASMLNYDSYYFMRLFKKKTGMSPSQYRKTIVPNVKILINYTDDIHKND